MSLSIYDRRCDVRSSSGVSPVLMTPARVRMQIGPLRGRHGAGQQGGRHSRIELVECWNYRNARERIWPVIRNTYFII